MDFRELTFDALTPELQSMLEARVKRLGYLGAFFRYTAVQPDILANFHRMTDALKAALPDRLTEVGALTVAARLDNAYERHQHERLSEKLGFGRDWIAEVLALAPDMAAVMDEPERAMQRLVLAMLDRNGHDVGAERDALVALIGADATIAALFLVGRYTTHAMLVNALDLAPPVPSIFAEESRRG